MSRKIHWLDDDKKYLCNKNLNVVPNHTVNPSILKDLSERTKEIDKITCKNCIKKMVYKYPFVVPYKVMFNGRKVILPSEKR